jgi:hypothetical protein
MKIDDTVNIFKNNKIIFKNIFIKDHLKIEEKYNKIQNILDTIKQNKETFKNANINLNKDNNMLIQDDDVKPKILNAYSRQEIMSLRQEIELLKVGTAVKMAKHYISQNNSVVIFTNFTQTIVKLKEQLNTNCVIWGLQKIDERNKAINDFCNDKSRLIICNIRAGSEGISLHDMHGKYPRKSIIFPSWSAQDLIQALGRIYRAMGKTDCIQEIIYCKGTIEDSMSEVIKKKINNIRLVNDGKKTVKNDKLETLLHNGYNKKIIEEEKKTHIYKIKDVKSIQNVIDNLEYDIKHAQYILNNESIHSLKYDELKYNLDKLKKELDFNIKQLKLFVSKIENEDDEWN